MTSEKAREVLIKNRMIGSFELADAIDFAIKALPSVNPVKKVGRWKRKYTKPNVYADLFWYCSACGDKCGYNNANLFEYCPHCGAKMQEVES